MKCEHMQQLSILFTEDSNLRGNSKNNPENKKPAKIDQVYFVIGITKCNQL